MTKRPLPQVAAIPGVKILLAGITYDVIVIKEAHKKNCPLVSRAGYSEHYDGVRPGAKLRAWLKT